VLTDQGWAFQSKYDWGWLVFHYGRWLKDRAQGWVWAPAAAWAPSWVSWRYGDGKIGWAPVAPRRGIDLVRASGRAPYWTFVATRDFLKPEVGRYRLSITQEALAFTRSRHLRAAVKEGTASWFLGPNAAAVASATGSPVSAIHVTVPSPGQIKRVPLDLRPTRRKG
jgi:hypothetical protein